MKSLISNEYPFGLIAVSDSPKNLMVVKNRSPDHGIKPYCIERLTGEIIQLFALHLTAVAKLFKDKFSHSVLRIIINKFN
ncbi:MAG: hypothetical protein MZV63_29575 [Marinilabiliales bacterium]|nr:hypothetical protein [Marinilabiliales bacterium]